MNRYIMKRYTIGVIILIFCFLGFFSCKTEVAKTMEDDFSSKLTKLREFKAMEYRIDSLKQKGIDAKITVNIIKESFFPEDSTKNITLAFIEEDLGFAGSTAFIVKYDRDQKKIISVKKSTE